MIGQKGILCTSYNLPVLFLFCLVMKILFRLFYLTLSPQLPAPAGITALPVGARYSGQTILIICYIDKQIAQKMQTCLSDPDILLPEVGHLSGYLITKW